MRHLAAVLLAVPLLALAPAPAQAVDTCQGKVATIVQSTGTVNGTDGDDVIVAGDDHDSYATTTVLAGAGDDTVCVLGAGSDVFNGGSGVDSVELVGDSDSGALTVVDFEHLDVRTGMNLGDVHLEWTTVPAEALRHGRRERLQHGGEGGEARAGQPAPSTWPRPRTASTASGSTSGADR